MISNFLLYHARGEVSAETNPDGRPRRHPLGAQNRRPWHDLPEPLPALAELPPPLAAVGAQRHAGAGARGARQRSQQTWRPGPLGVLYRRHLRGARRGRAIGKTKRGKGTNLTASADGS